MTNDADAHRDLADMMELVTLIIKAARSPYKKQWIDNPQCDIKTNRESRLYDAHNTNEDVLASVWTHYCRKQYHTRFPNMWETIRHNITHTIEQSHRVKIVHTDCGHTVTYDTESNSTYDRYGYGIWWEVR